MTWLLILLPFLLLFFWEIWICEGAHLGRGFVIWLYDLSARHYERIKCFDRDWEKRFLGDPLAQTLGNLDAPCVLDVGAGTGRVGRALNDAGASSVRLINLEPSKRMLKQGLLRLKPEIPWIRAWADALPFADESFDLVVSLEMLEFTPDPHQSLLEMRRVLRRGGWLLVTNRVGREAPWILGRTITRQAFEPYLADLNFEAIDLHPWQVNYDLAWARKPWHDQGSG
jgi:ubiquinone/menaquinone biosynthesis C-methylase UbiE